MSQPSWRLIAECIVPDPKAPAQWTPVLDYAPPGKLLKVVVSPDPADATKGTTWQPKDFPATGCSADGDFTKMVADTGDALVAGVPRGALIARIGGSSAEQTVDTAVSPALPARVLFGIGRFCVFSVPTQPVGALFLGVNDAAVRMGSVTGGLHVSIYEAI